MEKKYAVQGIIGCLLFGIGDWLLGYVDPKKVPYDVFYFISAGHGKVLNPCIFVAYLILAVAMIDLIIVIARGKTKLKKSDAFITPLTWMLLIGAISFILPASPFSKGLYTFCMNGGMIVWFVRLLNLVARKAIS